MKTDLFDRAHDAQCIVKGVHDIIMAGAFNLDCDNTNASFVIMKALDFAEESLDEVLAIAGRDLEVLRNGLSTTVEDAGAEEL